MNLEKLPIDDVLPELLARLRERNAVVLHAPTGAGKTTRVPPALIDGTGRVIVLEPRRVAARAAARRMAHEHGTPLGQTFGYSVRFDKKFGLNTKVICVTPGILLRMFHDDPFLETVSCVVFDEFHERGIEADLALGMVRLLRQTVRHLCKRHIVLPRKIQILRRRDRGCNRDGKNAELDQLHSPVGSGGCRFSIG